MLVDVTFSEVVSGIVRESFKKQAEELGLNAEEHSGFAAFETAEDVKSRIKGGDRVVLAYSGEDPVGTISFCVDSEQPLKGYIKRLAVLPEFRGRGFGRELMSYAEGQLKRLGVSRVELAIVKKFKPLQRFYKQLGYLPIETRSYPFLPFEVLYLEKQVQSQE